MSVTDKKRKNIISTCRISPFRGILISFVSNHHAWAMEDMQALVTLYAQTVRYTKSLQLQRNVTALPKDNKSASNSRGLPVVCIYIYIYNSTLNHIFRTEIPIH